MLRLLLLAALALALGAAPAGARQPAAGQVAPHRPRRRRRHRRPHNGAKVRLVQIDTPEVYFTPECYGEQASAITKRLLPPGPSSGCCRSRRRTPSTSTAAAALRHPRARRAERQRPARPHRRRGAVLLRLAPRPFARRLLDRLARTARARHLGFGAPARTRRTTRTARSRRGRCPKAGTTGFEPAPARSTGERSSSELRPQGSGAGGIRTHGLELMRLARTAAPLPRSVAATVWPAGVEPAISGARNRRGGRSPTTRCRVPPAGLEPAASGLRARRHLPFDHGGMELRRQGLEPAPRD